MRYAVVIEKGEKNWSAYVPDLPGCVAAGDGCDETIKLIQEAIEFHLEGILLDGGSIPESITRVQEVTADVIAVRERVRAERSNDETKHSRNGDRRSRSRSASRTR